MPVPLARFVKQLEDSGILAAETLRDFIPPKASPKNGEELARELVRSKILTKFQVEEVSRGNGKSLVLGNYVLMEKIGSGGMGQVFKARHRRLDRIVAVKLLPTELTRNEVAIARFEREVKAAARLRHPNIVAADDADQCNGVHFLVMELVDGSDLSHLVKQNGPFPVAQAVRYIKQAASGLKAAHAAGIVHRDIKPGNLLLDKQGTIKILDMGLARLSGDVSKQAELTDTGVVMGTVDYMPPEQATDTKTADVRSDIYSLGCTLYFLLTGKPVYDGNSLMAKLLAHRDQPIPSLRTARNDITGELDALFRRMIAKSPDDRYRTMANVLEALEQCHLGDASDSASSYGFVALAEKGIPVVGSPGDAEPVGAGTDSGGSATKTKGSQGTVATPKAASPAGAGGNPRAADTSGSKRSRSIIIASSVAGGLVVIGTISAWLLGAFGRSSSPPPVVETKPEVPAVAIAPFSAEMASAIQKECALSINRPADYSNTLGMKLVLIPKGQFDMGTSAGEIDVLQKTTADDVWKPRYASETSRSRQQISKAFYMGVCEVTQSEYEQVMGTNPGRFSRRGSETSRHPVESVTWRDAVEFCNRLSSREGLTPCYELTSDSATLLDGNGYRLPSEEEWEFACRAGTITRFSFADTELSTHAWFVGTGNSTTHPVGQLPANAFGLFDMHGNVREWCQSPFSPGNPDFRVTRGGSWQDQGLNCRSATRVDGQADLPSDTTGFRVVVGP
jgi:serine/threonine protein kinase/formylglycine-generating enzyme required for sulfatase activity